MIDMLEILGLCAGALTAFATLPQSFRMLRTKDVGAVSALSYLLLLCSYALWLIYGMGRGAISIIVWNILGIVLASIVLYLKFKWKRRDS